MNTRYIVTGASGHLGNTVVKELISRGKKVRALVLPGEENGALDGLEVKIVRGDVLDTSSLEALFHNEPMGDSIVIHAAGIVSITAKSKQKMAEVNVTGTKNIIDMCLRHPVKRLIYISSVHAIPEGEKGDTIREASRFSPDEVVGLYAQTKAQATQAVLDAVQKGLDAVVVHPSGIIGPGDFGATHTTQLVIDYLKGRLTAGAKGGYDFVDVRDVAGGILSAVEKGEKGSCYILSSRFITIAAMLDMLHKISGKRKINVFLPLWFAKATAPLSEIYYKIRRTKPLYTRYSLDTLQSNAVFSHKKADTELAYTVRSTYETLSDTVKWLYENKEI